MEHCHQNAAANGEDGGERRNSSNGLSHLDRNRRCHCLGRHGERNLARSSAEFDKCDSTDIIETSEPVVTASTTPSQLRLRCSRFSTTGTASATVAGPRRKWMNWPPAK